MEKKIAISDRTLPAFARYHRLFKAKGFGKTDDLRLNEVLDERRICEWATAKLVIVKAVALIECEGPDVGVCSTHLVCQAVAVDVDDLHVLPLGLIDPAGCPCPSMKSLRSCRTNPKLTFFRSANQVINFVAVEVSGRHVHPIVLHLPMAKVFGRLEAFCRTFPHPPGVTG